MATAAALVAITLVLAFRNLATTAPLDKLRASEEADGTHYRGYLYIPRGGPSIVGFHSPEDSRLTIDGKHVVTGKGIRDRRLIFPEPGPVSIDFRAPANARLLWHPPGRRGPLEYVPASSLSSQERFDASAGTSYGDGIAALAVFAILLLWLLFLFRAQLRSVPRRDWLCLLGAFAGALAVRCIGLGEQGQTWDEDVNWSAGRNYITNLLSLDFSAISWSWNYEHPPVMKYLAGVGAQFEDGYGVSRFLSAVQGALACAFMVPIGTRLVSLRTGVAAALFCALTPHLIAHSQVVGHEAPTMLLWCLGIWLALRAFDEPLGSPFDGRVLARRVALIAVVVGLALMSRFINGLLAPLVAGILVVQAPARWRKQLVVLGLTLAPVIVALTAYLVWPRLWGGPIEALQESWDKLKRPHTPEPFLGAMTNRPPVSYFAVYLYAVTPVVLIAGAAFGTVWGLARRRRALVVAGLWLFLPLIVSFSPVRQDGVRYVLPSLFALNLLAAFSFEAAWERARRTGHQTPVLAVASVAVAGYLTFVCVRIHPYYLDYYGEQVGGTRRAAEDRAFEVAWWGEGMNEALAYLNAHAPPGARVYKAGSCFQPGHLAWMRGDLWRTEARRPKNADWFLVYQPHIRRCPVPDDAELLYEVKAQGAALARVYRRMVLPRDGTGAREQ